MPELFLHQKEGIAFLGSHSHAILADEMGLGKTRQAIIAARKAVGNVLVICPASLKVNWEREIRMVYPDDEIEVVQSGPEKVLQLARWTIINYDMLGKYKDQLLTMTGEVSENCGAIVDEAHYIKGKSQRAKTTLEIVEKLGVVYCLTGTPIMNRPVEMFNLLRATKHPLGKNRTFFSKRYCGGHLKTLVLRNNRVLRFWDETGATRLPELHEMTKDVLLRRTKAEVLDLPPKIVSVQSCELKPDQKRIYDTAWDNYVEYLSNHPDGRDIENILTAQALVEMGKLKQVCSQAKVPRIVADIANAIEQGEKVIVFTQYTQTLRMIAEQVAKLKYETGKTGQFGKPEMAPVGVVTLSGEDKMDARQASVDAFQNDPATKVFVANIIAGGVGLTLTAASIVMFADMDWSPEVHRQAEDRAHRIGQEGTVNVYYYVLDGTVEEDIVDILQQKREIIDEIMEGKRSSVHESSMAGEFLARLSQRLSTPQ